MNDCVPFGMLFEEPVIDDYSFPQMKYNLEQSISVVRNEDGEYVPFVQENWAVLGTETATKSGGEGTDEDRSPVAMMGTKTVTEVRRETTDSDKSDIFQLGTETVTRNKTEATDSD